MRVKKTRQFVLYLIRWQASTIILAPCIAWLAPTGPIISAAIANLIGGVIFYFIDKRIFNNGQ